MKKGKVTLEKFDNIKRSAAKIHEAQEEYFKRLWFFRTHIGEPVAVKAQKQIMEEFDDLINCESGAPTDFDHGFIAGKLSALRWVMGADWDMLDT